MDNLMCPKCSKEFELPLRHVSERHPDDEEYMRLPRLLPCLHTVCQACLEKDRDRSKFGKIVCSVCHRDDIIKGVKYLPLDVSALVEVMGTSFSTSLAHCSRCIEQETSYAWCITCSAALCELHFNEHEASNDTGAHSILPLDEINAKGVKISPKLPQVICPEEINCVCSCYCFDCMHLLSSESSFSKRHANHSIKKCEDIFEETKTSVDEAVGDCLACINILNEKMQSTQNALTVLDSNTEKAISLIELEFNKLREEIKEREKVLKEKVYAVYKEKSHQYLNRFSALQATIEDCNFVCSVADGILRNSSASPEGNIYALGAADQIVLRADDLMTEVKAMTNSPVEYIDPRVEILIDPSHISTIRAMVTGVGHLEEYLTPLSSPFISNLELPMTSTTGLNAASIEADGKNQSSFPEPLAISKSKLSFSKERSLFFVTSSGEGETISKRNKALVPGFVNQTAVSQHVVEIDVRRKLSDGPVSSSLGLEQTPAARNSSGDSKSSDSKSSTSFTEHGSLVQKNASHQADEVKSPLVTGKDAKEMGHVSASSTPSLSKSDSKLGIGDKDEGAIVKDGSSVYKSESKDNLSINNESKSKEKVVEDAQISMESILDKHGGALTGKVIVSYELDKRLASTFELRSFYESWIEEDGCPIIKVTKSIVPK